MTAAELVAALGGKWHGGAGMAKCPAHEDRSPSLSISDGDDAKILVHCHAGCSFDAIRHAMAGRGLWPDQPERDPQSRPQPARRQHEAGTADAGRRDRALTLWAESKDARGTIVELYLASRRLTLPAGVDLRFHQNCPRGPSERLPAMLALYRDIATDEPCGLHRTFLRPDGIGKAEGNAKMMLARSKDAAIKMTPDDDVTSGLGLTEGIETGLAVVNAGWRPVWSCGSSGGIAAFPVLPGIETITIFADHDQAGMAAARACATRWRASDREALIRTPRTGDWNDVIKEVAA